MTVAANTNWAWVFWTCPVCNYSIVTRGAAFSTVVCKLCVEDVAMRFHVMHPREATDDDHPGGHDARTMGD